MLTLFMSLTYVKKMSDWSYKCFGMWHNLMEAASSTRRSVNVCQHWHVSYSRKLRNFSSPTVWASYVTRRMITYLCWDCSLNKHYNVWHVFVAIYVHNFCQNFAWNNNESGSDKWIYKQCTIWISIFSLNCISFSCYTCLKVFITYVVDATG